MQPISSSHSSHHTFHPKKTTRFAFCCCFQQNAQSVVPYVDKKRVFTILNYIPEEYYYEELYQEVSSLCSYFEDYPLPSLVWTIKNAPENIRVPTIKQTNAFLQKHRIPPSLRISLIRAIALLPHQEHLMKQLSVLLLFPLLDNASKVGALQTLCLLPLKELSSLSIQSLIDLFQETSQQKMSDVLTLLQEIPLEERTLLFLQTFVKILPHCAFPPLLGLVRSCPQDERLQLLQKIEPLFKNKQELDLLSFVVKAQKLLPKTPDVPAQVFSLILLFQDRDPSLSKKEILARIEQIPFDQRVL